MIPTEQIEFSTNWNKKLNTNFFTTIRLSNTAKYHVGKCFKVIKKEEYLFDVIIKGIRYCKIDELPEFTCYTDTGYSKDETIKMLKTMYSKKQVDWSKQLVSIILLESLNKL